MIPQLLIWVVSIPVGQAPATKPAEAKKEIPAEHRVLYIGRGGRDIEPVDDRPALSLTLTAAGDIVGDGKYVADDAMIKKWLADYCTGHPRAGIVVGVREPDKTTIRTMDAAIERLKKYVPKATAATFFVSEDG
jgi:hypothetical protein